MADDEKELEKTKLDKIAEDPAVSDDETVSFKVCLHVKALRQLEALMKRRNWRSPSFAFYQMIDRSYKAALASDKTEQGKEADGIPEETGAVKPLPSPKPKEEKPKRKGVFFPWEEAH